MQTKDAGEDFVSNRNTLPPLDMIVPVSMALGSNKCSEENRFGCSFICPCGLCLFDCHLCDSMNIVLFPPACLMTAILTDLAS